MTTQENGFVLGLIGQEEGSYFIVMACNLSSSKVLDDKEIVGTVFGEDERFITLNSKTMLMTVSASGLGYFKQLAKEVKKNEISTRSLVSPINILDRVNIIGSQLVFGEPLQTVVGGWHFKGFKSSRPNVCRPHLLRRHFNVFRPSCCLEETWRPFLSNVTTKTFHKSIAMGAGAGVPRAGKMMKKWVRGEEQSLSSALKIMEEAVKCCYEGENLAAVSYYKIWCCRAPIKNWWIHKECVQFPAPPLSRKRKRGGSL